MPYGKFATVGQVAETFGISLKKAWCLQEVQKNSIKVPDYKAAERTKRPSGGLKRKQLRYPLNLPTRRFSIVAFLFTLAF